MSNNSCTSKKNITEHLFGFSTIYNSPLTVGQAERLVKNELSEGMTEKEFLISANRKLAEVFGLPWKRGRTIIKKTPEHTRDHMIDITLRNGLVDDYASAENFVDNLINNFKDLDGHRGYGFFLTDGFWLGTRYGAFRHIKHNDQTLYKPVIHRDNSDAAY